MAKTNAEHQAAYRQRMKEAGFVAHVVYAPKGVKVPTVLRSANEAIQFVKMAVKKPDGVHASCRKPVKGASGKSR